MLFNASLLSRRFVLSAILVIIPPSALTSDLPDWCDKQLKPSPGHLGYQERYKRCEGLYKKYTAADDNLQLVSVLKGKLQYVLQTDEYLRISVPVIESLPTASTCVRAFSLISARTSYQMDTILQGGTSLVWPLDEVLRPNSLSHTYIGIYGYVDLDCEPSEEKTFVPLLVVPSSHSESDFSEAPINVTFISRTRIEAVAWRIWEHGNSKPDWQESAKKWGAHSTIPG